MARIKHDDDDLIDMTVDTGAEVTLDPLAEIDAVVEDLEALLKNGDVIAALSGRGVNASLALVGAGGLRAYLSGNKAQAAEDLATAAEEIRGRLTSDIVVQTDENNGRSKA